MTKKTVEPTGWEQSQIDKRLARQYPQMSSPDWVARLKKETKKQLAERRSSKSYQLGMSGMTRKEVNKLGGK